VFVALVGVIVWRVSQQREPAYQGKPLSEWLKGYRNTDDTPQIDKTDEAVRRVGTNAIPTLLRALRMRDSALKVKLITLAQRQHIIKINYMLATEWNHSGAYGFAALRTNAWSAVPALIEITDENNSLYSRQCAIYSLGLIGPPAKAALPSLLRLAEDPSLQSFSRHALRQIDPKAAAKAVITNSP
jgi:hypothetical protein